MYDKFEIEGIELTEEHINSVVTYVPRHANGNASHKDAEHGTIMHWNEYGVMINYVYNKCRTPFELLRWG
jgi:hypothetical protein